MTDIGVPGLGRATEAAGADAAAVAARPVGGGVCDRAGDRDGDGVGAKSVGLAATAVAIAKATIARATTSDERP